MRFLVVEDEPKTGEYLQQGLSEAGFVVDLARNGLDDRHLVMTGDYDLLILDVMLPDLEGRQILHALCSIELAVPVLFLTTRDSVIDRVKGLGLDADDYMVKPFTFAELLAHTRALPRRGNAPLLVECIQVADLMLDLICRRVPHGDQQITLTSKEFSLPELLVRRHGEVLLRSLIVSQVWDMSFDSDTNMIDVAVRRPRARIDDNFEPKSIHTIHGMGHVLEGLEGRE